MGFDIEKFINENLKINIELFLKDEGLFEKNMQEAIKIFLKDEKFFESTIKYCSKLYSKEIAAKKLLKVIKELDKYNFKWTSKKNEVMNKFYQYLYSDNYVYLNGHKLDAMKSKLFNKIKNIDKFEEVFETADEDVLINDMIDNEVLFLKQDSMEKEICSLSLEDNDLEQIRKINPSFHKPNPSNCLPFLCNFIISGGSKDKVEEYLSSIKDLNKYEEAFRYIFVFTIMWSTYIIENNIYADLSEENNFLGVCNSYKEDKYSILMKDKQMRDITLNQFIKICLLKSKNKNSESINDEKVKEYYTRKDI